MRRLMWVVVGATLTLATAARAGQPFELDGSFGYSHVMLDAATTFHERDGMRVEPRFTFGLGDHFRLGIGIGSSGYFHDVSDDEVISVGNDVIIISGKSESLGTIEPEVLLSWRQTFGRENEWFIEPGVGIGAVVVNYWAGSDWGFRDSDVNEWDAAFAARPFVRAGYLWEHWFVGIEVSYMFGGNVHLTDQVRGDVRELYVGGFVGGRW